jgi:REP element-mobilizing transposase RayT
MTVLPDHIHLLIEALPSLTIADCSLAIANNTRQWMEKKYWGVVKQADAWDVWRPSFSAGTVGEYTTAQVWRFLSSQVRRS